MTSTEAKHQTDDIYISYGSVIWVIYTPSPKSTIKNILTLKSKPRPKHVNLIIYRKQHVIL